jgi:hypothetical protein
MFRNETQILKKSYLAILTLICDYISKVERELAPSINYVALNLALEQLYLHKISTRPSAQGKKKKKEKKCMSINIDITD